MKNFAAPRVGSLSPIKRHGGHEQAGKPYWYSGFSQDRHRRISEDQKAESSVQLYQIRKQMSQQHPAGNKVGNNHEASSEMQSCVHDLRNEIPGTTDTVDQDRSLRCVDGWYAASQMLHAQRGGKTRMIHFSSSGAAQGTL